MCFRTMALAVKVKCTTAGEKLVLLMLADRTNGDTGECYPSHARLAEDCCMSVASVKNHIRKLHERGLLNVLRRSKEGVSLPNVYTLNFEGVGQPLTGGGSTIAPGVGQPLATNLEVEPRKKPLSATADVLAVFDYWKQVMKTPKSKLDSKRQSVIKARLTNGFTVDDLKQAVDGCKKSPFHMGENDKNQKHNDIELICRNAPNVERFMQAGTSQPATSNSLREMFNLL